MAKAPWNASPVIGAAREDLRGRIAAFCDEFLNAEYRKLCLKLLDAWMRVDPTGAVRGKSEVTAAAVIHVIGTTNELFYAESGPRISARQLADAFGVSVGGMGTRSLAIRETLGEAGIEPDDFLTRHNRSLAEPQDDLLDQLTALMRDVPGAPLLDGEFVDDDRPAMSGFYDLMDRFQGRLTPAAQKELRALVEVDPDYYDPYLALAETVGGAEGRGLRRTACERAVARVAPGGVWPERIDWGFLENRHILRALMSEGVARWDEGDTAGAAELFARMLAVCPNDNAGARYCLLALREGMTFAQYERRFGGGDALQEIDWFNRASARYPEDFAAWRALVEGDDAEE